MTTTSINRRGIPTAGRRTRGVSMIEVLIAVFTLSVGALGVAGLQLTAKRSNFEAAQRATATALAQDIVERMRMNPLRLDVYTNDGLGRLLTGSTMAPVNCSGACTADQLAGYDLFQWEGALRGVDAQISGTDVGGLTRPTACITGPAGGPGVYTIAIAWRGMIRLTDAVANGCGQGSGLYDDASVTGTNVYRRVIVIQTFISEVI